MTLLAGIWHRRREAVPAHLAAALDAALSRSPTDVRQRFDEVVFVGESDDTALDDSRMGHQTVLDLERRNPDSRNL